MGEAERVDLNAIAANLSPGRRAELVDFAAFLAARESQQGTAMTDEDHAWLTTGAADVADRIAAIEDELPIEQVQAWHAAMAEAAIPARYVPGVGLVIEDRHE